MSLPNVVIVGAPKCGTSSVFAWLADHVEVGSSCVKETFYLMDKGNPLLKPHSNFHEHGLDGYKAYFSDYGANIKVIVEATAHYMYQKTALEVLSSFNSLPHIIIILRKPSERVFSDFRYTQHNLANIDKNLSFFQFVHAITSDSAELLRDKFFGVGNDVLPLKAIKYSQYIDYIPAWVSRFGMEHVHIFLFENMKKDPRTFMKELSQSIGIEPDVYQNYNFQPENESFSIKNHLLHRYATRVEQMIPQGKFKEFSKRLYLDLQTDTRRVQITPEDRAALLVLDDYFMPFNQQLACDFNIDISTWK